MFIPLIRNGDVSISPSLFHELQEWTVIVRPVHQIDVQNSRSQAPLQQNTPKDADLALPNRIGRLLSELGCAASSSVETLRSIFTIAGDSVKSLDLTGLLYILVMVANKEDLSPTTSNALSPETKEDIQMILKQYPDLRSLPPTNLHWEYGKLASVIKELLPLDYDRLLFALDNPLFFLKGPQGFHFLITVAKELSGKPLSDDLLYRLWKNPDKQVTFLHCILDSSDDYVDFSASPNQIV